MTMSNLSIDALLEELSNYASYLDEQSTLDAAVRRNLAGIVKSCAAQIAAVNAIASSSINQGGKLSNESVPVTCMLEEILITDLGLPKRVVSALQQNYSISFHKHGEPIDTVGKMLAISPEWWGDVFGIGETAAGQIVAAMHELGFTDFEIKRKLTVGECAIRRTSGEEGRFPSTK